MVQPTLGGIEPRPAMQRSCLLPTGPSLLCNIKFYVIWDWSLIRGGGWATKREGGGASEVLPLQRGGGGRKKF